jgi:hypothetical protein
MKIHAGTPTTGLDLKQASSQLSKDVLTFTTSGGVNYSSEYYPLNFRMNRQYVGLVNGITQYLPGGGHGIQWEHNIGTASPQVRFARLIPVIRSTDVVGGNTAIGYFRFILPDSVSQSEIVRFDATLGNTFFKYGSGNITGTPTRWAAWDASGKFIETTAADIVAAGLPTPAYGEWYQDSTVYATVIIDTVLIPRRVARSEPGELNLFDHFPGQLVYEGTSTAKFSVNYSATLQTDVSGAEVTIWVYKNGVPVHKSRKKEWIESAGVNENVATNCIVELAENDTIEVWLTSSLLGDVLVTDDNLNVIKI